MKVLVLNGSPSGDNSVTLYTAKYLEKRCEDCEFVYLNVGQQIKRFEKEFEPCAEALARAELIVFCYPVYTFLVPAQLHRFIELIKQRAPESVRGKWATQLSTSKHFYDVTAHRFIQDNCDDLGLRYIEGLSADMDDLLTQQGRKQASDFFEYVRYCMENGLAETPRYSPAAAARNASPPLAAVDSDTSASATSGLAEPAEDAQQAPAAYKSASDAAGHGAERRWRVAVVADFGTEEGDSPLRRAVERFADTAGFDVQLHDLRAIRLDGGCLGCFNCAADGKCVYRDGFDDYLRASVQTADAIVYAFTIRDHSMGSRFKMFDDRQFCNGHRTVTMGKPVGYIIEGELAAEPNLEMTLEARAQVGGNFLAGIAQCGSALGAQLRRLGMALRFALDRSYAPPKNFYGVGGLKIFRDLIYQMRGLMRADHKFYKRHGFYDFPQKRRGRIIGMYAVGAMMNNPKLRRKLGGRFTEGMVMPYKKALDAADETKK